MISQELTRSIDFLLNVRLPNGIFWQQLVFKGGGAENLADNQI